MQTLHQLEHIVSAIGSIARYCVDGDEAYFAEAVIERAIVSHTHLHTPLLFYHPLATSHSQHGLWDIHLPNRAYCLPRTSFVHLYVHSILAFFVQSPVPILLSLLFAVG